MTDRVAGFTVVLGKEMRIDDFEDSIGKAIYCMKNVVKVEPVIITSGSRMAAIQKEIEIRSKLYEFIKEEL